MRVCDRFRHTSKLYHTLQFSLSFLPYSKESDVITGVFDASEHRAIEVIDKINDDVFAHRAGLW